MWVLYHHEQDQDCCEGVNILKVSNDKNKLEELKVNLVSPAIKWLANYESYIKEYKKCSRGFFNVKNFDMEDKGRLQSVLKFLQANPNWLSRVPKNVDVIIDDATCQGLKRKTSQWAPVLPKFTEEMPNPFYREYNLIITEVDFL